MPLPFEQPRRQLFEPAIEVASTNTCTLPTQCRGQLRRNLRARRALLPRALACHTGSEPVIMMPAGAAASGAKSAFPACGPTDSDAPTHSTQCSGKKPMSTEKP